MPASDAGITCEIAEGTPAAVSLIANGTRLGALADYEMIVGDTYILSLRRDVDQYDCHVERADAPADMADTGSGSAADSSPAQSGLRVHNTTANKAVATYQWVMVVSN